MQPLCQRHGLTPGDISHSRNGNDSVENNHAAGTVGKMTATKSVTEDQIRAVPTKNVSSAGAGGTRPPPCYCPSFQIRRVGELLLSPRIIVEPGYPIGGVRPQAAKL